MTSIYEDYFYYVKKWKNIYGEKTLVIIEVGKFYEIYALRDHDGNIHENDMEAVEQMSFLNIGDKKIKYNNMSVLQAGFNTIGLDKFVKIFQENDYTTVIYEQDSPGKNATRSLSQIISPGTYIDDDTSSISNVTLCIWIEHTKSRKKMKESITFGVSSLDIFTGMTTLFETTIDHNHSPNSYDQLEQQVSIYNPKETILISNLDINTINDIKIYIGLEDHKCYIVEHTKEEFLLSKYVVNSFKQNYQLEILLKYFPNVPNDIIESELIYGFGLGLQCFIVLLDYMYEHNCDFIKKLYYPEFTHNQNKLVLANYSLKQLNIIDDNRHTGKLKSVGNFLNNCLTCMGKRKFLYDLHNPSTEVELLNLSYELTDSVLQNDEYEHYRKKIKNIIDLDKFKRLLLMNKITPKKLAKIHSNLLNVVELAKYTSENNDFIHSNLIKSINNTNNNPQENAQIIIDEMESTLDLSICANISETSQEYLSLLDIENLYFIKRGKSSEIDCLLNEYSKQLDLRLEIQKQLSTIICSAEKKPAANDYVKCNNSSKTDNELFATDRRCKLLMNYIKNLRPENKVIKIVYSGNDEVKENFLLHMEDIVIKNKGNSKQERNITSPQLKEIMTNIHNNLSKLIDNVIIFYKNFIVNLTNYIDQFDVVIAYVSNIDVLQNKAYIAHKYNYCRPTIDCERRDKSYVDVEKLRHPLIEHLQQNEIYVTNDLKIGIDDFDGLLLYGTNAVGKTSFIRAMGIAVIMAQSGLYVPCSSFTYRPYDYIFTRILGNDNLFKSLSTFAVEMCELRTILKNSNANSLILGDELCSGTESSSALSIFTAGLQNLHKKNSTFLFATHFHEIINYEEIIALTRIRMMHMEVIYNEANDCLVYNRKLKEGPGNSMYGLEVCKSLGLPDDFLKEAMDIRIKYNEENSGVLSHKQSHYNAKKIKGMCEVCNEKIGEDIHHLQYQNRANDTNDYIDDFHKNHKANLVNICKKCHDNIHQNDTQFKKAKTTKGYMLERIE
tara:strand:+ start:1805 stop:4825 length:3021 start_codon:yes stop_codon:yes gene_type:complete